MAAIARREPAARMLQKKTLVLSPVLTGFPGLSDFPGGVAGGFSVPGVFDGSVGGSVSAGVSGSVGGSGFFVSSIFGVASTS